MSTPARESSCIPRPVDDAPQHVSKMINHRTTSLPSESNPSIWSLGDPTRPSPKAPEDSLTHEMKSEVKSFLIHNFYHERRDSFRRELRDRWTSDLKFPVLNSPPPIPPIRTRALRPLYHKATFLYWLVSGWRSQLILACFHWEWFRYHDEYSDIDFDHFIASPIHVTSDGPSGLPHLLDAHKDLIDQAATNMSAEATSWLQSTKSMLLSLCRGVFLVLDRLGPYPEPDSDGFVRLGEESQRQNVLIIRTHDEESLSKPITFEKIRMHALPLARDDIPEADNGVFAIRVSISIAVKFIVDLKHREEAAIFSLEQHPTVGDVLGSHTWDQHSIMNSGIHTALKAEAWADAKIRKAERDGVNSDLGVKYAVIDIHQARRGEQLPDWQPCPFIRKWK